MGSVWLRTGALWCENQGNILLSLRISLDARLELLALINRLAMWAHNHTYTPVLVRQCPGLPGRLRSANTRTLVVCRTRSSFGDRTFVAAGPQSGTVCGPMSDYVDCHMDSSGSYWRYLYSDSKATAQCELFLTAPNRNILTYLYTYKSTHFGQSVHYGYPYE